MRGATTDGERDILGIWAGDGAEGARVRLPVFSELKNRSVDGVLISVCDAPKKPSGSDHHNLGTHHRAAVRRAPDPQQLPLRRGGNTATPS